MEDNNSNKSDDLAKKIAEEYNERSKAESSLCVVYEENILDTAEKIKEFLKRPKAPLVISQLKSTYLFGDDIGSNTYVYATLEYLTKKEELVELIQDQSKFYMLSENWKACL